MSGRDSFAPTKSNPCRIGNLSLDPSITGSGMGTLADCSMLHISGRIGLAMLKFVIIQAEKDKKQIRERSLLA